MLSMNYMSTFKGKYTYIMMFKLIVVVNIGVSFKVIVDSCVTEKAQYELVQKLLNMT